MVTSGDERRFFSRLIRLIFCAVSLATIIAFFSRVHWFAELFSNFRFYFLLTQALLVLIFLHSQRWVLMTLTVLLAIPNGWYVMPYLTPFVLSSSVAAGQGEEVEIVAVNLNYRNDNFEAMRAYLDSASPDIIVVAEITQAWRDALAYLDDGYPYQIGEQRPDPWGLRVYSRVPFVEADLLDLSASDSVNARIVVEAEDGLVQIFAVHLISPTNPQRAASRNAQLKTLARRISESELPTVVVGDLNLTPFSPYFAELLDDAGIVDARRPAGIHFTWPTSAVPLWIPIDHALADPSVHIPRVQRGSDAGSDHFPLEISIGCCTLASG